VEKIVGKVELAESVFSRGCCWQFFCVVTF